MTSRTTSKRKDHSLFWVILVAVITATVLVLLNVLVNSQAEKAFAFTGASEEMTSVEPKDPNAAIPVSAAQTPASQFIKTVFENSPDGYSTPVVDLSGTPNNALSWVCSFAPSPIPVTSGSGSHAPERASVTIHAFGAGQGATVVRNARTSVQSCTDREGNGGIASTRSPIPDTEGFVATYSTVDDQFYVSFYIRGDVMISVASPDLGLTRNLTEAYDAVVMAHLPAVCESVEVALEDSKRNPYYNREAYTGWERGREVTVDVQTSPALLPGVLNTTDESNGSSLPRGTFPEGTIFPVDQEAGERLRYEEVYIPQRPLDPVPVQMPDVVPPPLDYPSSPGIPPTTRTIPERVEDVIGPGCGWVFTQQAAPIYDDAVEKERADEEERRVKAELRSMYVDFLNQREQYVLAYADYARSVFNYNKYGEQVSEVARQWDYINTVRAEYRAQLDRYWRAVRERERFTERQQRAQTEYDAQVNQCVSTIDQRQQEWRERQAKYEQDMERYNEEYETYQDALEEYEQAIEQQESSTPAPNPTSTPGGVSFPAPCRPRRRHRLLLRCVLPHLDLCQLLKVAPRRDQRFCHSRSRQSRLRLRSRMMYRFQQPGLTSPSFPSKPIVVGTTTPPSTTSTGEGHSDHCAPPRYHLKGTDVRKDNEGGFTLPELLASILIIGVLAAIAVPIYLNQKKAFNDADVQAYLITAVTPMEVYRNAHGGLYPQGDAADPLPAAITGRSNGDSSVRLHQYKPGPDRRSYCLAASAPDGSLLYHITSSNSEPQSGDCP